MIEALREHMFPESTSDDYVILAYHALISNRFSLKDYQIGWRIVMQAVKIELEARGLQY